MKMKTQLNRGKFKVVNYSDLETGDVFTFDPYSSDGAEPLIRISYGEVGHVSLETGCGFPDVSRANSSARVYLLCATLHFDYVMEE